MNIEPAADWRDDQIREIAVTVSVSREAVVRRLLTFNLKTPEFYRAQRAACHAQREAQKARERESSKDKEFPGQNRAQRAMSDFWGNYGRLETDLTTGISFAPMVIRDRGYWIWNRVLLPCVLFP